jgi:ribosomal protein L37AE/L43A
MTLRKREDTGIWKVKHCITLFGGPALREATDLLQDRLHNEWTVNTFIVCNINAVANKRKKVTYKKYWPELIQDLIGSMWDKQGWEREESNWHLTMNQYSQIRSKIWHQGMCNIQQLKGEGWYKRNYVFSAIPVKPNSHIACRAHATPMPCVNSHMPCRAPALLLQCRVLCESPLGSRKYPNC